MKPQYLFSGSLVALMAGATIGAPPVPPSISVGVKLCDVFGVVREEFRIGEPIWARLEVRNAGREPFLLLVPGGRPDVNAVITTHKSAIVVQREDAPYYSEVLEREVAIRPNLGELVVSVFVGEHIQFTASGAADVRIALYTTPELETGSVHIVINGRLSKSERSELLRAMYEAYGGGSNELKGRILRSLIAIPSGGEKWDAVASLGVEERSEGFELETINILRRTDLPRTKLAEFVKRVATSGVGEARNAAHRLLEELNE